jgi:hypothetical protein
MSSQVSSADLNLNHNHEADLVVNSRIIRLIRSQSFLDCGSKTLLVLLEEAF